MGKYLQGKKVTVWAKHYNKSFVYSSYLSKSSAAIIQRQITSFQVQGKRQKLPETSQLQIKQLLPVSLVSWLISTNPSSGFILFLLPNTGRMYWKLKVHKGLCGMFDCKEYFWPAKSAKVQGKRQQCCLNQMLSFCYRFSSAVNTSGVLSQLPPKQGLLLEMERTMKQMGGYGRCSRIHTR